MTIMTQLPPYITIDANGFISRAEAPRPRRRRLSLLARLIRAPLFLLLWVAGTALCVTLAAGVIFLQGAWLGAVLHVASGFR